MNYLGYPVTLGYLEKVTLDSGTLYTHRGIDLGAFTGDPVVVAGTQIGLAGETGKAEGPHVHVQAGRDEWAQQTIDPAPYIDKPGTVVKTGTGSEWGMYVCINVGDVYVYYCHLSRIDVLQGQVIKGGDEVSTVGDNEIDQMSWAYFGYGASQEFIKEHRGTESNTFERFMFNHPVAVAYRNQVATWRAAAEAGTGKYVPVEEQLYKKQ